MQRRFFLSIHKRYPHIWKEGAWKENLIHFQFSPDYSSDNMLDNVSLQSPYEVIVMYSRRWKALWHFISLLNIKGGPWTGLLTIDGIHKRIFSLSSFKKLHQKMTCIEKILQVQKDIWIKKFFYINFQICFDNLRATHMLFSTVHHSSSVARKSSKPNHLSNRITFQNAWLPPYMGLFECVVFSSDNYHFQLVAPLSREVLDEVDVV